MTEPDDAPTGSVRIICPFSKPIGFEGSMTTLSSSRPARGGTSSLVWASQVASTTTSAPAIASPTEPALAFGPSPSASAFACASSAAARTTRSSPATRCRAIVLPRLPTPMIAVVTATPFRAAVPAASRRPGRRSWVHRQAVAVVEPDRLHQPERDVRGEHVRGCQHAGVLLDDRGGSRLADRVEVALDAGPEVRAALLEVGRRIDAVEGAPRAGLEISHVLLMQDDVLARAEPAQMATDE